jgi:hypothetical protein
VSRRRHGRQQGGGQPTRLSDPERRDGRAAELESKLVDSATQGNRSCSVAPFADEPGTSEQAREIKPADVQALMKATLAPVQINPLECDFAGGSMKVNIRLDDAARKQYTLLASPAPGHELTGVGDQAYWFEPADGHTTPWIESYKGSVACEVSAADPPETTIPYTGSGIYTITDADAAAYAAKEGALCSDVFSAS